VIRKRPRVVVTDEQIDKALALAAHYEPYWLRAVRAAYEPDADIVRIDFKNDMRVDVPRRLLQGLENATPTQLAHIEITELGEGLHWEALDVDHYIPGLLNGVFGTRRWMAKIGRNGGRARTPAKARAARANGSKGGRPKKTAS